MLKFSKFFLYSSRSHSVLFLVLVTLISWPAWGKMEAAPPAIDAHLQGIASFAKSSPVVSIPDGWFLMGTNREDRNRHSLETHYDNTEFPQTPYLVGCLSD